MKKKKHTSLTLTTASDLQGRFNNKSINGPAPTSKLHKVVQHRFKNIKKLYQHLNKDFDKSSLVIDSLPRDEVDLTLVIALNKENFYNKSQLLTLDIEKSDTLGNSEEYHTKIRTEDDIANFIRNTLGYQGSYILTSSSRWELKGQSGWHVYIPLTNTIDRTLLKRWLITKLNDSGNLWMGCSWDDKKPTLTKYKRSDIVDIGIYSVARKIYEAEQVLNIEGRRKIVKLIKGNGTYLSTRSVHNRLSKYKKEIIYKTSKAVKKQLKINDDNGAIEHGSKKEWVKHNKQLDKGIYEPIQELYIPGANGQRELKVVAEIVHNGIDVRYEGIRSKENSFDGAYYADSQTFRDFKENKNFKMNTEHKHLRYKIQGQYINSSVISDEDGITYVCAPTGSGKTHYIQNVDGTKILLVPKKALCENLHNPQQDVYYVQATLDTKYIEGTITEIKKDVVNVMTYDKFNSLMQIYELDNTYKIYVDEIQNLLETRMLNVASILENNLKHFNRVTFLSASLHRKYLPFLDRSYTFYFNRKLHINIVKNADMQQRISKNGFHIIFNENKQQNIDTAKELNALNVYSGNLQDIEDNKIDTTKHKHLLATTVMSEGVSLYLDKRQTVSIHITKATDASLVIQMASRIRNAKKIKVIVYATKHMYSNEDANEIRLNINFMESRLKRLKEIWEAKDSSDEHRSHYKAIMDIQANKYAKATDTKTQVTSYFNLFSVTREYEKKLERHSFKYFKNSIRQFTKCKVKIKTDDIKTTAIVRNRYDRFDDIEQIKECIKLDKEDFILLPMVQQKQVLRYSDIQILLNERYFEKTVEVSDTQMIKLTYSDANLNTFKRHIKLLDNGIYEYLKDKRVFRHFKKNKEITESRLISLSKRLVNYAQFLRVTKLKYKGEMDIDYMEVLNGLIQFQPVLNTAINEPTYMITSYKLWGQ